MPPVPTEFTPFASLIGGVLIGLSAVLLMAFHGRIAGISGIAVRLFPPYEDSAQASRLAFIAGLVVAPLVVMLVTGTRPAMTLQAGPMVLAIAGFLVGFGSVLGSGCTSGHGICGLSRLSIRSAIATAVFMSTAVITVFLVRHGV